MGFSITALAQKARTQTLIVDSDLDMGQYDITATDVKGDTAEFSEFVGGVGNFESGIVSGGLDVSGIIHGESNLQVDGNIVIDGSINNVNIAYDGSINGVKLSNGAITGQINLSYANSPYTLSGGTVTSNASNPDVTNVFNSIFNLENVTCTYSLSGGTSSFVSHMTIYHNDEIIVQTSTSGTTSTGSVVLSLKNGDTIRVVTSNSNPNFTRTGTFRYPTLYL